jgi:exopolyphosphatase/guanosine-5'-triphosphate,3'-diphosphate pyrophosphatase
MRFGAIDIGSNAVRLHVCEVVRENDRMHLERLFSHRFTIRLGKDVFNTGHISPEKTAELEEAIRTLNAYANEWHIDTLRAVGTSAFRDAKNGKAVVEEIHVSTGVHIDIISGEEEAKLIRTGILSLVETKNDSAIMMDVGGGSTEISAVFDGQDGPMHSFNAGTVRILANGFTQELREEMATWVNQYIPKERSYDVFATGGNIRRIHKILGNSEVDPLCVDALKTLREEMDALSLEQRMETFDLNEERADVIVPAMDLFLELLKNIPCSEIYVPEITLSDGVACTLFLR